MKDARIKRTNENKEALHVFLTKLKLYISKDSRARFIDVGGGPSGPSIEGPFCRTVHLCRTLEDRKMGKKRKKRKKIKKKKGKIEKRTERSEKKEKIAWI